MIKQTRLIVVLISITLLQTACGFHLRGSTQLPAVMKQVFVHGTAPSSELTQALRNTLRLSGGHLTSDRQLASAVLHVIDERRTRREVSLSDRGKANEYALYYVLTFELKDAAGTPILTPQTIEQQRDYFNPQIDVIGKSEEEAVIWREMLESAVRSLIQRARSKLNSPVVQPGS